MSPILAPSFESLVVIAIAIVAFCWGAGLRKQVMKDRVNAGWLWNWFQILVMASLSLVPPFAKADGTNEMELKRLEVQLDRAMTQGEMNVATGELARFWDSRLAEVETRIEGKLNKKERKDFSKSKKRWRAYRAKEVAFQAKYFEGGSIQPLMANDAYNEITKHRVTELDSFFQVTTKQGTESENLTIAAESTQPSGQHDVYFLPCSTNASVSFEGVTQLGREIHRLEVRRLAYLCGKAKEDCTSTMSCVIYYFGDDYGPTILRTIDDCMDPFVRKMPNDTVEIYYLAGAHSHFRQRWKLIGYSAEFQDEIAIDWGEDPRNQLKQARIIVK
jgi:uncharacterized protein YecT (DUF1311 family)